MFTMWPLIGSYFFNAIVLDPEMRPDQICLNMISKDAKFRHGEIIVIHNRVWIVQGVGTGCVVGLKVLNHISDKVIYLLKVVIVILQLKAYGMRTLVKKRVYDCIWKLLVRQVSAGIASKIKWAFLKQLLGVNEKAVRLITHHSQQ